MGNILIIAFTSLKYAIRQFQQLPELIFDIVLIYCNHVIRNIHSSFQFPSELWNFNIEKYAREIACFFQPLKVCNIPLWLKWLHAPLISTWLRLFNISHSTFLCLSLLAESV